MTQEHINIGSAERAGDGESLRTAFAKIESNFIELYARQSTADGNTLTLDVKGDILGDDSTVMVDSSNNTIVATGGITGNVTGQVSDLSNHSLSALSNVSNTVPSTGQVLKWNGSEWEAGADSGIGGDGAITIAGDDSTQRTINGGETLSILGDANISTTTDAEGVLSISLSPVVVADVKGNVLGDDSTVIVDYLNNTVTTNVLDVTTDAKINTLYTANIDTLDSSAINIIPPAIFNSDVTVGNTLYTANIDTLDSSAINIAPPAIFNSDVTIENTLTLTTPTDLPTGTTIGGATINTGEIAGANVTVSDDPPVGSDIGDLWWESDSLRLKVRYNDTWIDALPVGGGIGGADGNANVTVSDDAPGGTPASGDLWWESDTGRLKIRYDNFWVDASPVGGGGGSYTPATASDWNGTAPTTIGAAIDRLATLVKTLNSGTGA
jgi:hypothetical protein